MKARYYNIICLVDNVSMKEPEIRNYMQCVLRSRNYLFQLRLRLSKSMAPALEPNLAPINACRYLLTQLLTQKVEFS